MRGDPRRRAREGITDTVRADRLTAAAFTALQAALAAEHAAAYGYGVAGAHLSGRRQQQALTDLERAPRRA